MLVSFPSPHTTSRAKSQQPWLSTLIVTDPPLCPCVPVMASFTAGLLMWRCLLTSWSSLSFSGGGSSGNGPGSEQIGLHWRWDMKSWHTIGRESLEAWAVYQRGRQETTGSGFALVVTIFREAAWLWWFSCSPMVASLSVLDCVSLGQSHVENFLAQSVLLRETQALPESSLPSLTDTAILYSSFLLFEDMFMGSWDVGTLHLDNSFSPSQEMVFEVVLVPEWTEHLYSSNKYPLFVFQIHYFLI